MLIQCLFELRAFVNTPSYSFSTSYCQALLLAGPENWVIKLNLYLYLMQAQNDLEVGLLQWLISDLIPKKSEKFEFRKNFVTIFFSVKNWPKNEILNLILQFFENCEGKKNQNFIFWVSFWHWKIWSQNFSEIRTFRIF